MSRACEGDFALVSGTAQTYVSRPPLSHASERACRMTVREDGARSMPHTIRLKTPDSFAEAARCAGTVNTGQSERAITTDATGPTGRSGLSAPGDPMTIRSADIFRAKSRIWVAGSPCLTAEPIKS